MLTQVCQQLTTLRFAPALTRLLSTAATPPSAPQPSESAKVGRLNHVAIAVPDLEAAAARYRTVFGTKVSQPQPLPEHGVTVVFIELPNTKLELLHPLGPTSPIRKFLERNPTGGIHHICLEVPDVAGALETVGSRIRALGSKPQIGAHGNPVVFLHPKDNDGVLMELEEVGRES